MRVVSKYKGYHKLFTIFEKFPLRINSFKSTKWKRVQKLLRSKLQKRVKNLKQSRWKKKTISNRRKYKRRLFVNNLLIKVNFRYWYRVENHYENGRRMRNVLSSSFDGALDTNFYRDALHFSKKSCLIDKVYSRVLFKPEFRLDILLWKLNFFRSCYQASQAICDRKVNVNGRFIRGNHFLRKGDIISFNSKFRADCLNLKESRSSFLFSKIISTFVEVDYYSNLVVILKNVEDLSLEDSYLMVKDSYCLKKIKDYI
jgi:ribosomal protein S4